jgi:high-affinity Fe2+/Pb2+ permease
MNQKKLKKATSIVIGLLIAFFADKWLNQAMQQPTEWSRWIMVVFAAAVLFVIVYWNLDDEGNL